MNSSLKTVLLTVATLSLVTIAMIELSGVSKTALLNKWKGGATISAEQDAAESIREKFAKDSAQLAKVRAIPKTEFTFTDTLINFGKMKEGDSVSYSYKFTNTGKAPLLIADVRVSCGCTVPSYSKDPVEPGQSGSIDIVFHSKNKPGLQHKQVHVIANTTPEQTVLRFDAEVIPQ